MCAPLPDERHMESDGIAHATFGVSRGPRSPPRWTGKPTRGPTPDAARVMPSASTWHPSGRGAHAGVDARLAHSIYFPTNFFILAFFIHVLWPWPASASGFVQKAATHAKHICGLLMSS